MKPWILIATGLSLFGGADAQAAGLSVSTSVSDANLSVGDVVTLEIHAVAQIDGQLELQIPKVDGLSELSRSQSEGTSISWTGSGQRITREQTLAIEYQVERAGRIDIPAITGRIGSLEAQSSPLALVVGGSADPPAQAVGPGEVVLPEAGERNLFVRYRVNRPEAYLGEEILLDLEIFVDPSATFSISDSVSPPQLDGFWREVLEQPKRLERRAERLGNRSYHVYRIWRLALYGLQAGERTVEPASLTFTQGQSIFGGGRRARRKSLPLLLKIKPLPTEGRPADFNNNNVGHYELSASVDHERVPAGKAVVLTLSLAGAGNIKSARLPAVDAIPGFRVFPPTFKDDPQITPQGVRGKKQAEILLMPEVGGRLEIPSITLPIFDPETGAYRRLATQSLRIVVDGTPAPDPVAVAPTEPPPSEPSKVERQALRPLRYRSDLRLPRPAPWLRPVYWGLLTAPGLLYGLLLGLGRLKAAYQQETPKSRQRAAQRGARARLLEARTALERGDTGAAHARFAEALLDFGSQKLGTALQGLTHEQLEETLRTKGASAELAAQLKQALVAADYARFAPGGLSAHEGAALLEAWERLLGKLEAFVPKEAR